MKVYISVDIEGIAGSLDWDETEIEHPRYAEFRELMTGETLAAIEGAKAAGANEIVVKDAHSSGRNILIDRLPADVRIIRGWSGHPFGMVEGLDKSFDAVVMIGYHASAGSEANALAHTLSGKAVDMRLNGVRVSEAVMHAYAAALVKVPLAFVSGDAGLCDELNVFNPAIVTLAVKRGTGAATNTMTPAGARDAIREGVTSALRGDLKPCLAKLPDTFSLEIIYGDPVTAHKMSFYPGMEHAGERKVRLGTASFYEVLRALQFVV
ncbi:MAG: M55 family metallopeptidase [Hyphomicrobiaceae bacterium]